MHNLFGIIPAAGTGTRFGTEMPKQFQQLVGRPVVDHAILALLQDQRIVTVHVICAPDAPRTKPGASLPDWQREKVQVHALGGATRAATVAAAAGLFSADPQAWLVVHDAVRPCLHSADLKAVLDAAMDCQEPAVLAEPLAATLKQASGDRVVRTVPRADMWLAQTPQVMPAGALVAALAVHREVTDEAQALELAGVKSLLVAAQHLNPKVTCKADLQLLEAILRQRIKRG